MDTRAKGRTGVAASNTRAILVALVDFIQAPIGDLGRRVPVPFSPGLVPQWVVIMAGLRTVGAISGSSELPTSGRVGRKDWERWIGRSVRDARKTLEDLVAGRSLSFKPGALSITRTGRRLVYDYSADERTRFLLGVLRLIDRIGADRLRRCPLEGCGRLFVARRRQLACRLEHAQQLRYQRWVRKGKRRGTRGERRRNLATAVSER